MEVIITKDIDELSQQAAGWICAYIEKVLKKQDRFTIVLSGGSTPKKLYQLLASDKFRNKIDWSKIHFFWGDERCVPFTDERNNAKMAFKNLLGPIAVIKENIHVIPTDMESGAAAVKYEKLLHHYFPDTDHTFDLVLLGMGDNAHTLSLFPGYDTVQEKEKWVTSLYLKEQKMQRITLTAPVINAAGCIAFLVSGADKSAALNHVLSGEYDPDLYPAQVIRPYNGELFWWVDEAAAASL